MAHAEKSITVPRSGPAVYAFLADLDNVAAWIPAIQRLEPVAGTAGEVGAEYTATVAVGGATREGRLTVVRLDPPTGIGVRIAASPIRIDGTVAIHDLGDSAQATVVLDAPTSGLLRLADGPIAQALRDALEQLPRITDAIPPG